MRLEAGILIGVRVGVARMSIFTPPRELTSVTKAAVTTEHWNTSFAFQDLEIEAQAELLESPDFIEAVTSHIENRQRSSFYFVSLSVRYVQGRFQGKSHNGGCRPQTPLAIPPHSKLWGFLAFSHET